MPTTPMTARTVRGSESSFHTPVETLTSTYALASARTRCQICTSRSRERKRPSVSGGGAAAGAAATCGGAAMDMALPRVGAAVPGAWRGGCQGRGA